MTKAYSRHDLMRLAIAEHLKCTVFPRVGAVVVKDGAILSTGYKGEIGEMHAERAALEKLKPEQRQGATIYTTLEPCVKLHHDQKIGSCADLIVESGISEVVIGVLDPNGTIYCQGYKKLLENNVSVTFFDKKFRDTVEEETFEYGSIHRVFGSGTRRIPVPETELEFNVQFSETDVRTIPIRWRLLLPKHGSVDLHSANGAIRHAKGVTKLSQIRDPDIFRFPDGGLRMSEGMIAVIKPDNATFCVLVQLKKIFENDILIQWEVRNIL